MALTRQRAMNAAYGFRDQEGTETTMLVHESNPLFAIVDFVGFVEYITYAKVDLANAITALSDSPMTYMGLTVREAETVQAAFGTGEAEKKGVFLWLDANGAPLFRMAIPGIKESLLVGNGRDIDLANAAVTTYMSSMVNAIGQGARTANNVALLSVTEAYKQHRHSTGSSRRRSG